MLSPILLCSRGSQSRVLVHPRAIDIRLTFSCRRYWDILLRILYSRRSQKHVSNQEEIWYHRIHETSNVETKKHNTRGLGL